MGEPGSVKVVLPWDNPEFMRRYWQEKAAQDAAAAAKASKEAQDRFDATPAGQAMKRIAERKALLISNEKLANTLDTSKKLAEISKALPSDPDQMWALVNSPNVSAERRAKVLEVVMFRSMDAGMVSSYKQFTAMQKPANEAVMSDPKLFEQLSQSTERVGPHAGTPASFFLSNQTAALKHDDAVRQKFEEQLSKWPAETQGRMLYHAEDSFKDDPSGKKMMEGMLAVDYGKMSDAQKTAFKEGYTKAHDANEFPKDVTNMLGK